jgi:hypothetical protein
LASLRASADIIYERSGSKCDAAATFGELVAPFIILLPVEPSQTSPHCCCWRHGLVMRLMVNVHVLRTLEVVAPLQARSCTGISCSGWTSGDTRIRSLPQRILPPDRFNVFRVWASMPKLVKYGALGGKYRRQIFSRHDPRSLSAQRVGTHSMMNTASVAASCLCGKLQPRSTATRSSMCDARKIYTVKSLLSTFAGQYRPSVLGPIHNR